MSARETAELLLLVGRLVQAEGYDGELSPAQWMALRFLARANSFSRTPSAFAEFQATTRGTASQAIKSLGAGGYLVRQRSEADGRSVTLRLTGKGNEALARDPFEVLVRAVDFSTPRANRDAPGPAPSADHGSCEWAHRRFGVCQDCTYLGGEAVLQLNERDPLGRRMPTLAFRSSPRTLVSSASIFSQRASTARTDGHTDEFTTAIC